MERSYGEKNNTWHLEISLEMNNLHLCESDVKSSEPKWNEPNTGVFVVAEFDFHNHLNVGPKFDF